MRMRFPVLGAALLLCGSSIFADDHLVSSEDASARLKAAGVARQADLAALDQLLSTSEAGRTASALGVDLRQVKGATSSLSDQELRDLAIRASALKADPPAGLSRDVDQLLVIFLIVAIVILVLKAVD